MQIRMNRFIVLSKLSPVSPHLFRPSTERDREPSTFAGKVRASSSPRIDESRDWTSRMTRTRGARRLSCRETLVGSFEDATIFRGASAGTRQRGSTHSRERREYRPVSPSLLPLTLFSFSVTCRETSVSRLYSTRGKKPPRSTIASTIGRTQEERERFWIGGRDERTRKCVPPSLSRNFLHRKCADSPPLARPRNSELRATNPRERFRDSLLFCFFFYFSFFLAGLQRENAWQG